MAAELRGDTRGRQPVSSWREKIDQAFLLRSGARIPYFLARVSS